MDASAILFYMISVLLVLSSLMVVFLRNVVHCALALVAALFLIAVLFVILHAPMLGVLQVLVYAGAIMVLFLFVIMFLSPTAPSRGANCGGGSARLAAVFLAAALVVYPVQWRSRPRIPSRRPKCSVAPRRWERAFLPILFCPLRSLPCCCWWPSSAPWFWPRGSLSRIWCRWTTT